VRLKVILLTTILGALAGEAVFFIFTYPINNVSRPVTSQIQNGNNSTAEQAFLLPVSDSNYSPTRDFNVPEPQINAKAAALYDVQSGRLLFSKNPEMRLPIASITKLMTAIVVLENLNQEEIYTVRPEDINAAGLGADLYKNEKIKAGDLLKIMLIKSSNDAALTFASSAQKHGIDLVSKMNERATSLGMGNTHFADPAGLNDSETFSTVGNLIKLVKEAIGHSLISQILTSRSADVSSIDGGIRHHLVNTDQLLGQISSIILGKTGFTDSALGTMALAVKINGNQDTLISIILGSNDRFGETKNLIDWAKKAYQWK
jgi:D-alanyl-D-alanine carboxypeptidase (penicillin-binding protein 5/6)